MPKALITGASSGIGAAAARCFAASGWDLLLTARRRTRLEDLAAELGSTGVSVAFTDCDLTDAAACRDALSALLGRGGCPDVLINNAGTAATGHLEAMPSSAWDDLLQINLSSVFHVCRVVIPPMREAGGGLIINVSSHAARHAFPGWGAYCVSKAGLDMLSRCLREEHRQDGIRVSTLTLGAVDSPLWDSDKVAADFDRRAMLPAHQAADALLHLARQPADQVIEDLTLMPAAGAL